jgi:hypothetical protein
MYCPECGHDADKAKFCPECGTDLSGVQSALGGGKRTTGAAKKTTGGAGGSGGSRPAPPVQSHTARGGGDGFKPAYLWAGIAVLAVIVLAFAIMRSGGGDSKTAASPGTQGLGSLPPAVADTKGTYAELKKRADGLYNHGEALLASGDQAYSSKAGPYFAAAAKVYAAAWKKNSSDPNLATDWSYVLFESGDNAGAVARVNDVIRRWPDFQPAWHHKGLFLMMDAFALAGDSAGKRATADAKAVLEKAVALGPDTKFGQEAKKWLGELENPQASTGASATP